VVAGRLATAAGGNDILTMRLVPSEAGSAVRTQHGTLHLPGFELRLEPTVTGRAATGPAATGQAATGRAVTGRR
jgi:hypothetical protein